MTQREGLLLAGEIGKPHGVSGEVYVIRISDDPGRFEPGARLMHADGRELVVAAARPHRNRFLVKFSGIDTREQADALRGAIYVAAAETRSLDEDEYWQHDLVGCSVVTEAGDAVGRVTGVVPGRAHDLLTVGTDTGDHLVPIVKEIVISIDLAARVITVDLPEGLLELDAGAP